MFLEGPPCDSADLEFGNAAIVTLESASTGKPNWQRGGWWDALREFWRDLAADGLLAPPEARPSTRKWGRR